MSDDSKSDKGPPPPDLVELVAASLRAGVPVEPVALTPEQAAAREKVERAQCRRGRKNFLERARRASLDADAGRLAGQLEGGKVLRPLLAASRYMSRRGARKLRTLAEAGSLPALRILADLTRSLALLQFAAQEREWRSRGQPAESRDRKVFATWPTPGEKA